MEDQAPAEQPEEEPEYATRISRWRHTTSSGGFAVAIMVGLQSLQAALEGREIQQAQIVLMMDASGDGGDDDLDLELDPYDPRESRATFKARPDGQ